MQSEADGKREKRDGDGAQVEEMAGAKRGDVYISGFSGDQRGHHGQILRCACRTGNGVG